MTCCRRRARTTARDATSFTDLGKDMWSNLTGNEATIDYTFVDMTIEVPRCAGPDSRTDEEPIPCVRGRRGGGGCTGHHPVAAAFPPAAAELTFPGSAVTGPRNRGQLRGSPGSSPAVS